MNKSPFASASRSASFLLILLCYLVAVCVGAIVYGRLAHSAIHPLVAMLFADIAATVLVFLSGVLCRNSSLYDPYWSVAPITICAVWFAEKGTGSLLDWLMLASIFFWGIRLTVNWALRWQGVSHEDWRYRLYRERSPKLWPLTNLFGIHLMPTLLVYLGLVPVWYALGVAKPAGPLSVLGFTVCICAATIQLVSDRQMDVFRRKGGTECIYNGLWSISRHPNYLGEMSFWWGLYAMQIGAVPHILLSGIGALCISLLFVFVSIPMMERHNLAVRPSYAQYQARVPMLLPFPKKQKDEVSYSNE